MRLHYSTTFKFQTLEMSKSKGNKRKRSNQSSNDSTINEESTSSKRQSTTSIDTNIISKSHYPKNNYNFNKTIINNNNNKHSKILVELIKDICNNESIMLNEEIDKNSSNSNKVVTISNVIDVINKLPEEIINNIPSDVHFLPELTTTEKSEIKSLLAAKLLLQNYNDKLSEYEKNIELFEKDYDLSVTSNKIDEMDNNNEVSFCYS